MLSGSKNTSGIRDEPAAPSPSPGDDELGLERFRPHLRLLARLGLAGRVCQKVDPSDVVQETLLLAYRARDQVRGERPSEVLAWLRAILENTLNKTYRDLQRARRDVRRERPLDRYLDSSASIDEFVREVGPTPIGHAEKDELILRLLAALEDLPEEEREALTRHKLEHETLAQIQDALGRSRSTVVRLIRSALERLRRQLEEFV